MRTITLLVVALWCTATTPAHAQAATAIALVDSTRILIDDAVDRGDLKGLESAIAFIDRGLNLQPEHGLLSHYRGYALYRAASLALSQSDSVRARQYLDEAVVVLEPLAQVTTIPETFAILASVYGLQIATSRVPALAGMQLGPKASEAMTRATEAGPRNPRVWVLRGINALNTPKAFGGGVDRAESYLQHALALFATDIPMESRPMWGRAEAHVWLGTVYARQGKLAAARIEYQAALTLQPNQTWISALLLPALDRPR